MGLEGKSGNFKDYALSNRLCVEQQVASVVYAGSVICVECIECLGQRHEPESFGRVAAGL